MTDQAFKLRELINENSPEKVQIGDARIIAISSGKGGVGKTNFTVNLGIALSKLGKKVTIIDADLGLANIDILLGLVPRYTLTHVLKMEKKLSEIVVEGPNGVSIVSGGSGVMDMVNLSQAELSRLIESLEYLNSESDYILIDTGAGLNHSVLSFIQAATELIVVVTSDPTSITDAYALIKNIGELDVSVKVVVNRVESNREGQDVFSKLNTASSKFLDLELENIGYIYEDYNVKKSVKKQVPFLIGFPNSLASRGVELVAENLDRNSKYVAPNGGFSSFIKKIFKK
ncbi:MinD/ParA family protein [Acidaminobacter sp. JC074]|uniref:MinD/ParA family protein n=1 Tax=Acidaminobacter sp. JC074 TaxID=2530199 RepID=UPI001F0DCC7E|nr:MinD/ParA family protein [Acidaminobacter sp. JC074]MCH4888741.1 MinD/ParA family protein [Acidaminobacter sp. JC074]